MHCETSFCQIFSILLCFAAARSESTTLCDFEAVKTPPAAETPIFARICKKARPEHTTHTTTSRRQSDSPAYLLDDASDRSRSRSPMGLPGKHTLHPLAHLPNSLVSSPYTCHPPKNCSCLLYTSPSPRDRQ